MIDFIHIGDYKTGTTWLQNFAFPAHPEIEYLGDPTEDMDLLKLLHKLIDQRSIDIDFEVLQNEFKNVLSKYDKNKIMGLSREVLCVGNFITGEETKQNAEKLQAIFGDVKIIYVIREQKSMIVSLYSQYLKRGGTLSLEDFIVDSFESKDLLERLKYSKTIKIYKEIFGEANVHIGLFEEFKYEKKIFLQKIYNFIQCKDIYFQPIESDRIVNPSLKVPAAYLLRILNRFYRNPHNKADIFFSLNKIFKFIMSSNAKNKLLKHASLITQPNYKEFGQNNRLENAIGISFARKLSKVAEKIQFGSRLSLSKDIEIFLESEFLEDNNKILKEWNLIELKKFKWYI